MGLSPEIKIGCCGFPVNRKRYFENLKVVEIQQTFYQIPDLKIASRWRKQAPKNFEFVLKAWQLITHSPKSPTYRRLKQEIPEVKKLKYGFFKPTKEVFKAWEETKKIACLLGAKIIVFQCPDNFKSTPENKNNLKIFFKKISRLDFRFVWEPRGNWNKEEIRQLCRELDLVHCVDPFKNTPSWGEINYFRLHGINGYNLRYNYTFKNLIELRKKLQKKINYCLFNNIYMFDNALTLKKIS